jgi:Spy/CpxP family protein refolding chaperone
MKRLPLFVLLLAAAPLAFAQPPADAPGRPGPGRGQGLAFMKDLNLSAKQMDDLRALRASFEKKTVETQSQIRVLRIDIRELAGAENPDRSAIEKKLRDISDLQLKEKLALVDHLFQARALLTPEQQKLFREHMIGRLLDGGWMGGKGMMRGGRMMGRNRRPAQE